MTKAQIELLMTRDVDDVSETAVHHPPKQLGVTLKNAAALLAREERKNDIDERLFVFKLLRFVQAALAGSRAQVTAEVAREIFASVRLVLKRNMASDLSMAARDVLSVLMTEDVAREMLENRFVSWAEILALHPRIPLDEPFTYSRSFQTLKALRSTIPRHAPSAKSPAARTKVALKPKGLL